MRNKFLGTGTPGYHPVRKVRTVISGLRYAVLYDASVAYKLVLSAACSPRRSRCAPGSTSC